MKQKLLGKNLLISKVAAGVAGMIVTEKIKFRQYVYTFSTSDHNAMIL